MANVLRNVVSKQRIRYKEKGFNLDLAYICDNIIAMGYPADNYESMYRNPLVDVYKFLEDNHQDHYKIYNLCLERSYDISKFHGRVAVYPFEDHNPPAIEMILKFCQDVDNWLKADPQNVVAVHCKAGKGRTGTMICCYLVYSCKYRTAEDALACYDEKRTKDRKGVTIPSQRRYVKYFSNLVNSDLQYERRTLQFCQIRFSKANTLYNLGAAHCSISALHEKVQQLQNFSIDFRKTNVLDIKNPPLEVSGDIKVEIAKNTKKVFHLWFNTFFVSESSVIEGEGNDIKYVYTLQKCEIDDAHKDKSFPDDFKIELVFIADENYTKISAGSRPTSDYRSSAQDPSTSQTSQQHRTIPRDSSIASGLSSISDLKLSASTSGTGSFGGASKTEFSNGYESNLQSVQRNNGVVQNLNNHHSNNHMTANENEVQEFSRPSPAQHVTLPPKYMEQQQHQQHRPTANKMHIQRQAGAGGNDNLTGNIDAPCQPSTTNLKNVNNCKQNSLNNSNNSTNLVNNSYNHNHSNSSSKTNSVSSESTSSAVGDNEEDWESANTTTIENNTQPNKVDVTNINTLNNISSADVIKTNNVKESESNVSSAAAEATRIESLSSALNNEMQYNQQRSKQIKLDHKAHQLEGQQPAKTQNQCSTEENNYQNISTTNNSSTTNNTNTIPAITTQQAAHNCLPAEADVPPKLKCC